MSYNNFSTYDINLLKTKNINMIFLLFYLGVDMVGITELAKPISKKTGLSQRKTREIINMFLKEIRSEADKGNKVRIANLGIFERRKQKARRVRNPRTGKMMRIKARKKFVFRPSGKIKYI